LRPYVKLFAWGLLLALVSTGTVFGASDGAGSGKILLVSLDDRPATMQYPEWLARIADHRLVLPPVELLGKFTTPGDTAKLASWLESYPIEGTDAIILSIDMLAYGGLIGSRTLSVSLQDALNRISILNRIRDRHPNIPVYAFNCIMPLAPTAEKATRSYREPLMRYAELVDKVEKVSDPALKTEVERLKKSIPDQVLSQYMITRKRNQAINLLTIRMVNDGRIDFLVLCQEDARPYGLHRQEQLVLEEEIRTLKLEDKVRIYPGADQVALTLLTRYLNRKFKFTPKIAAVYPSEAAKKMVDDDEDRPISEMVARQINALGGQPVENPDAADLVLYMNAPKRTSAELKSLVAKLTRAVEAGRPVALADTAAFARGSGGSDPDLIKELRKNKLMDRLAAYASLNTTENTVSTALSQATMYVLYKKFLSDTVERAARGARAQKEFLLQRYINDYGYHDLVRPKIYQFVERELKAQTDELDAGAHGKANLRVKQELEKVARELFNEHFQGRVYALSSAAGAEPSSKKSLRIDGLENLNATLPWPRPFEVRIEFTLRATME
jgi:hypothetical protein